MSNDNINLKELLSSILCSKESENQKESIYSDHFKIGEKYFIRMVTYHVVGRLKAVYENELVLSGASWVADSGRFHNYLRDGIEDPKVEIEPFINDIIIGRRALIDCTIWDHDLPTKQK